MNEPDFPPDVAASILEHVNDDHADAVLAIARAQGGTPDADGARALRITPRALVVEIERAGATHESSVAFDPPIDPLDTVRARLVALTKEARATLDAAPPTR